MENRGQMKAAGFVAIGFAALFALVGLGMQDSQSMGSVSGKAGTLFLCMGGAFFVLGIICLFIGIGKLNPVIVRRVCCIVVFGGLLVGLIYGGITGSKEAERERERLEDAIKNKDPLTWTTEEKNTPKRLLTGL